MVIVSWARIGVAPKAENRKRRIVQRLKNAYLIVKLLTSMFRIVKSRMDLDLWEWP